MWNTRIYSALESDLLPPSSRFQSLKSREVLIMFIDDRASPFTRKPHGIIVAFIV